jgi:hypothetical protein
VYLNEHGFFLRETEGEVFGGFWVVCCGFEQRAGLLCQGRREELYVGDRAGATHAIALALAAKGSDREGTGKNREDVHRPLWLRGRRGRCCIVASAHHNQSRLGQAPHVADVRAA